MMHTDFNTDTRTEMINHIKLHIEKGDKVEPHAIKRLERELKIYGEGEFKE